MSSLQRLALGGLGLCALAAMFAIPALYVPGLAALILAAIAWAWVWLAAAGSEVILELEARSAEEDQRVRARVKMRRGPLPLPGVRLEARPGAGSRSLRRSAELDASVAFSRRGRHALAPARLRITDPVGLCTRECVSASPELLVLPRVQAVERERRYGARERDPLHLDDSTALAPDLLRVYRAGTPASRIHWPTVAKTGTLMEHACTTEDEPRVLVLLDAYRPDSAHALDLAVRATASLCVHLARRGGCLLLLPDSRGPVAIERSLRGWPALHERLALLDASPRPPRLDASRSLQSIVYVTACARAAPVFRCRGYRVCANPIPGVRVAFTVAGCCGQPIGAEAGVALV